MDEVEATFLPDGENDDGAEIDVTLGWTCHRECVRNARYPDVPPWWERTGG
jgi:hypothetical protein